jgi:hypothetical protein
MEVPQHSPNAYGYPHVASPVQSHSSHGVASPSLDSSAVLSPYNATSQAWVSPGSIQATSPSSAPPGTPASESSKCSTSLSSGVPELPSELGADEERVEKSELDAGRERVAGSRALMLLQQTVAARPQVRSDGLTARQAAIKRHEDKCKMQHASNARYKEENGILKPVAKLATPKAKEKMAQTTRKIKIPDAVEDFETITDLKCQLDIERQQEAEKRALHMLTVLDCMV